MSVIHEALKQGKKTKDKDTSGAPPSVTIVTGGGVSWLWWLVAALFLIQTGLYVQELRARRSAQEKMHKALLGMNDERGKAMDLLKDKVTFEGRLAEVQHELGAVRREKEFLTKVKQQLEFDNVEKEKKASRMSTQLHELEMIKRQLSETIRERDSEIQKIRAEQASSIPPKKS